MHPVKMACIGYALVAADDMSVVFAHGLVAASKKLLCRKKLSQRSALHYKA
jgi:hypothetical protein